MYTTQVATRPGTSSYSHTHGRTRATHLAADHVRLWRLLEPCLIAQVQVLHPLWHSNPRRSPVDFAATAAPCSCRPCILCRITLPLLTCGNASAAAATGMWLIPTCSRGQAGQRSNDSTDVLPSHIRTTAEAGQEAAGTHVGRAHGCRNHLTPCRARGAGGSRHGEGQAQAQEDWQCSKMVLEPHLGEEAPVASPSSPQLRPVSTGRAGSGRAGQERTQRRPELVQSYAQLFRLMPLVRCRSCLRRGPSDVPYPDSSYTGLLCSPENSWAL